MLAWLAWGEACEWAGRGERARSGKGCAAWDGDGEVGRCAPALRSRRREGEWDGTGILDIDRAVDEDELLYPALASLLPRPPAAAAPALHVRAPFGSVWPRDPPRLSLWACSAEAPKQSTLSFHQYIL